MTKTPYHLGIILDGNRRWAEKRGLPPFEGHRKGLETVKKAVKWCRERGIKVLTLFVFSTENWKRSKKEVGFLMNLAKEAISGDFLTKVQEEGVRLRAIGQIKKLSKPLQSAIRKAESETKNNKAMTLNIAISYGGRAEIIEAIKNIIRKKIPPDKITEETIKENLWTSDVDLIIRAGKEQRISNFLIWQAAYSEFYFLPKYWPDFSEKELDKALKEYDRRQRRFGK